MKSQLFVNKRSFWRLFGEGRPDRRALVNLERADGGQARVEAVQVDGFEVFIKSRTCRIWLLVKYKC